MHGVPPQAHLFASPRRRGGRDAWDGRGGAADVVHSGEPGPAVERLARRVSEEGGVVDILAQVDFTGRPQGTSSADLPRFVEHLHTLEGLRPVGLMTLPPQTATPDEA